MDTADRQGGILQSFFNSIGALNTGRLSHLCINFPVVENSKDQSGTDVLGEDDLHSLKLLQENCTNLVTLEILLYGQNSACLMNAEDKNSQVIQEALSQIDTQLRSISSLKKGIVRYYNGAPSTFVMELMQGLGWAVLRGR
ncbi:hypothetical protein ONS95_002144 [Cadophora gregata]|uniref:uncharacterized protein n=1 Tax=Cadophora gregata TaxID=51156 RepID=UPI0026DCF870|nr:uncharacterized protein ONS95_002144 [Cadophora gregata]KAK0109451.1 hypothetical protein ONS95_002144 [Cadophora gregata]KAK0110920.1 hypothetical protein ONS96_002506 [Cadophora gregata f. sp. sojae]